MNALSICQAAFCLFFALSLITLPASADTQEVCLTAPVKLSEKMASRLKNQADAKVLFKQLRDDSSKFLSNFFSSYFSYERISISADRYAEAIEITDALVVLSSCLNKSIPLEHAYLLGDAAIAHEGGGDNDCAEQLFAASASIFTQQTETDNQNVTRGLVDYAIFLRNINKEDDALIWFRKAEEHASPQFLKVIRQLKTGSFDEPPESTDQPLQTARIQELLSKLEKLNSNLETLKNERRYAEAVSLSDEALAIGNELYGADNPLMAKLEMYLAAFAQLSGDYDKGENMYSHALGILTELGPVADHQLDAAKMHFASAFLSQSGKIADYEKINREVLESRRRRGDPPWSLAGPLANIAQSRRMQGYTEEAEQLYKESQAALVSSPQGKNNLGYAITLDGLASLYEDAARLAEALNLRLEAISILEQITGANHLQKSPSVRDPIVHAQEALDAAIHNLANLYVKMGENEKAEEMFRKSLKMTQEDFGNDDQVVISPRAGLAGFLIKAGRLAEARELLEQNMGKIALRFPAKNSIHRFITTILFGELDMATGRNASAAEYFDHGLEILNSTFASPPPKTLAKLLTLIGINHIKMKQNSAGISILIRAMEQHMKVRDAIMYTLNDRQKLNYLSASSDTTAVLLAALPDGSKEDVSRVFDLWLRWKGGLYETQHLYFSLANTGGDIVMIDLFNRLKDISRQLASLYLKDNNDVSSAKYLSSLEKEKENIETRLSKSSRQFFRIKRSEAMIGTDLAILLAGSTAYVDVAKIPGYDFKTMKFGPDRYFAFVRNNLRTDFISLGETEPIDSLVRKFQAEMRRAAANGIAPREIELRRLSRSIYSSVFNPLKAHLPADGNLYISPDGDLNLMPFEILEDTNGKQILDRYAISYATTGPDLFRSTSADISTSKEATLIADPDYDSGTTGTAQSVTIASRDLRSLHFSRLPETATEILTISDILAQSGLASRSLTGQLANDESLYALNAPRILHIATHGFFLKSLSGRKKNGQILDSGNTPPIESPLVRSGLALSGANRSLKQGGDTGLATVGKLVGLRLAGTDLVVLSACNTGVGDIEAGEGVFGLKRAISLAGARSLLTSLWSVPSDETVQLMTTFYNLWTGGKSKAQALQEAKLSMREKHSNPYFWGAFTLSGARN